MAISRKTNGKEFNGSVSNSRSFTETYGFIFRGIDHERADASITAESERRKDKWRKEVETSERAQNEKRFIDKVITAIESDSKVKETLMSVFDDKVIRREIKERVSVGLSCCSRDKESADLWKMYILTYGRVSEYETLQHENAIVKEIVNDIHRYADSIIRRYERF